MNDLDINYETAYHLQSHVSKITSLARLPQGREYPPGVYGKRPGDFRFPTTFESRRPSWELKAVGEVPDETLPHIKCMISIAGAGDGGSKALLRGELIMIISLIEQHLRDKRFQFHLDAPLQLFSFRNSMVSAIEAYMNKGQLVVRVTRWHDFKQENTEDFTLSFIFARW